MKLSASGILVTLSCLIAVPAALAIGRYRFAGREPLVGLFMSPLTVPTIVLGIAFLRFLSQLGINGTFVGLVLCHAVIITPYVLRLTLASVTGLDRRTEWAAEPACRARLRSSRISEDVKALPDLRGAATSSPASAP